MDRRFGATVTVAPNRLQTTGLRIGLSPQPFPKHQTRTSMQCFCPNCFEKVFADTRICPACGVDIKAFGADLTYEDKLIRALKHPTDETRMAAILALGGLHWVPAASSLADLAFEWPKDVWQALEIIRSLHKMPLQPPVEASLARLKDTHPSRPVRSVAEHVHQEMFTNGRRHHEKPSI